MARARLHMIYRRLFSLFLSVLLLLFEFSSIPKQTEYVEEAIVPAIEPIIAQDCHILTRQELSSLYSYKDDTNRDTTVEITVQEADLLMRLAASEAGDYGENAQLLVMNVVMNRLRDESFPDSIRDIIFAQSQFAVVTNGAMKKAEITTDSHMALARLEMGEDLSSGALYFESSSNSSESWHSQNRIFLFEKYGQRFYR